MGSTHCEYCGVALEPGSPGKAGTVRCKRCGHRTSIAHLPKDFSEAPVPNRRRPLDDAPVSGDAGPTRVPIAPESISEPRAPSPYFYSVAPGPGKRRHSRRGLIVGGIVLVATAVVMAWLALLMVPRGPARLERWQLPADASAPTPTPTASSSPPVAAPAPSQASGSQGAPAGNPPVPSAAASGLVGAAAVAHITVEHADRVFLNTELGLATFERQRRSQPVASRREWFANQLPNTLYHVPMMASYACHESFLVEEQPPLRIRVSNLPRGDRLRIRLALVNQHARDLIESRPNGSATLSEWTVLQEGTPGVHPASDSGSWEIELAPIWRAPAAVRLEHSVDIEVEVRVEFSDGSQASRQSARLTLLPTNWVDIGYPCTLGFMALIDPMHPYVTEILNRVNHCNLAKRIGINVSAGGDDKNSVLAAFLVWRELEAMGLRYQSLTGSAIPRAQVCRTIEETLATRNANCVDGTVLLCSLFERMGLKPMMVTPPGHAFLAIRLGDGDLGIETTAMNAGGRCSTEFLQRLKTEIGEAALRNFSQHELGQFDRFAAALELGGEVLGKALQTIEKGDTGASSPPKLDDALEDFRKARDAGDDERADRIRDFIATRYARFAPLEWARSLGVTPIPTVSERLSAHPLPPAPVSTR